MGEKGTFRVIALVEIYIDVPGVESEYEAITIAPEKGWKRTAASAKNIRAERVNDPSNNGATGDG